LTDSKDDNASNVPALDPSIIPTLIDTEMQNSYLDYAMSVIVSRALPDVRDGLNRYTEEYSMQCMKQL